MNLLFFEKSSKQLDVCFSNTMQLPHEKDFEKWFYQHIYTNAINTSMYVSPVDTTFHEDLQQKSIHLQNKIITCYKSIVVEYSETVFLVGDNLKVFYLLR